VRTPADADAAAHVFVPALDDRVLIGGDDGHHLQRVRRLAPGERVTAADDTGAWRVYEITETNRGRLVLAARGDPRHVAAPAITVALAVALTKGGLDTVVTHVTELGVARVIPVETARAVVRWDADRSAKALARLRAAAREAAMQSRRVRRPVIEECATFASIADRPDLVLADRTGTPADALTPPATGEWTVLVGPEGGLAPSELERLAAVPRLALGEHVLRAATAPVAAVAILADRIAQIARM
jgi:16S rRNA (uracil1498-N3)-methyltransferase